MKHTLLTLILPFMLLPRAYTADPPQVVGLCIAAPLQESFNRFLRFMEDEGALTRKQVKKLVETARENNIALIPQINLLGHQSWARELGNLLEEYPEFDENPSVQMPEVYEWPNEDGLYCKSYCPLHPAVHEVVFALVDEIMEVFEAQAFHAGMDEVFYIGEAECPRCGGMDRSELFAGEVNRIRDHLASRGKELWIWGDRLIDGETSGLGMWEASINDTHRAIDMIRRDVVICDWHYERADPTAAMFAMKGFRVITCPYDKPDVTRDQLDMFDAFRNNTPRRAPDRYYGFMQTIWSPASRFLDIYDGKDTNPERAGQAESLKAVMEHYQSVE